MIGELSGFNALPEGAVDPSQLNDLSSSSIKLRIPKDLEATEANSARFTSVSFSEYLSWLPSNPSEGILVWLERFELPTSCSQSKRSTRLSYSQSIGGKGGIRTHGRLSPTSVFKTDLLNHSSTFPFILQLDPASCMTEVSGNLHLTMTAYSLSPSNLALYYTLFCWCPLPDSNRASLRKEILSLPRLPTSPRGH